MTTNIQSYNGQYRYVYIDELARNEKFKRNVFEYLQTFGVTTKTALINGFIDFKNGDYTLTQKCGHEEIDADLKFMLIIESCYPCDICELYD